MNNSKPQLKAFITPSTTRHQQVIASMNKVNEFITKFNDYIKRGGRYSNNNRQKRAYNMVDALDNIPALNSAEFNIAVKQAKKCGWSLTQHPDNYNTTSYTMIKI